MSTSLSYYPRSPSADEGPLPSLMSLFDKGEMEESYVSSHKQKEGALSLKAESINSDKPLISEKPSEPILTSFKENSKQSSKKRKSRDKESSQDPVQKSNGFKSSSHPTKVTVT